MRAKRKIKAVASILALLILLVGIPVNAIAEESQGIDVFIVLDNSGSMVYNDSVNLRFQVVKKFIRMLNLGDSIGVLNFNTETDIQLPITEIKSYGDKRFLEEQINPSFSSKDTDVYAALLAASDEIKSSVSSSNTKFFILVTDGVIDPGPDFRASEEVRAKYYKKLDLLIEEYEDNIWSIFVVFLNPAGLEDDYLKGIAQKTGGSFYNLENANQFEEIFGQILDRIGAIKGDIERAIEVKMLAEAGRVPEIKVDIISPDKDGKYYYDERMNIGAQLLQDGRRLIEGQSTIVKSFTVEIGVQGKEDVVYLELNDQGQAGDATKGDGIYSTSYLPEEEGSYEFTFRATGSDNGKPFTVESNSGVEVLSPAIVNMAVDDKSSGIQDIIQGKKLKVYLDFYGEIDSKQIIEFTSSSQSEIVIKPTRVAIFPDKPRKITLEIPIPRNTPVGEFKILLAANIFGQGIRLEPDQVSLNIRLLPYEFLGSNQLAIYIMLVIVAIGFLICGYLIFIRMKQKTIGMINGKIICYKDGKEVKEVNLTKIRKRRIRIGSEMELKLDVFIESEEPFVFEIYTEDDALKVPSKFRVDYGPRYFVKATIWDTAIELKNGDSFIIGAYSFVYNNDKRMAMDIGRDILEKYEIGD